MCDKPAVRSHCSPPVIRAPLQQADRSSSRYSRPPCLPHRDFGAAEGLPLTAASSGRMTGAAAVSLRSRCLTPEPVSLRSLSHSGDAVSLRSCCLSPEPLSQSRAAAASLRSRCLNPKPLPQFGAAVSLRSRCLSPEPLPQSRAAASARSRFLSPEPLSQSGVAVKGRAPGHSRRVWSGVTEI